MKGVYQRREQRENQRRREERKQLVAEKRRRPIMQQPTKPELQNSMNYFEQRLLTTKDWREIQSSLNGINDLVVRSFIQPGLRTLSYLLFQLSTRQNTLPITKLLANITSLQQLNPQLVVQLIQSGNILVDLAVTTNDIEILQNIILTVGNLATQDDSIKRQVMQSTFFPRINIIVQNNNKNMELIFTVLWVYKNIMLRNRRRKGVDLGDLAREFVGHPVDLISFLLRAWSQGYSQQYQQQSTLQQMEKNKVICYQLLGLVVTFVGKEDYQFVWKCGLEQCMAEGIKSLGNMANYYPMNSDLICAILTLLSTMATLGFPLPPTLPLLLTSVPLDPSLFQPLLSLTIHLRSLPLTLYLLPQLDLIWQYTSSSPSIRHYISKYLLELFSYSDVYNNQQGLNLAVKRLPSILDDQNPQTVLNGLMAITLVIGEVGEEKAREVMEDSGVVARLIGLQMHQNKEVYQRVLELIELLEIEEDAE